VTAKEIKAQVLPELDDEFAKGVEDGYDSLDALKDHLREHLQEELDHEDEHTYQDAVMDELLVVGSVELPPIMVERGIDNHLREIQDTIGQRIGRAISLEEYVEITKKSEEELREETRVTVEEQLRRSYLLTQVAENESIDPTDEDVDVEIEEMAVRAGDQGEQVRQLFMSQENRDSVARSIRSRRTVERLVDIAKSEPVSEQPSNEAGQEAADAPETSEPQTEESTEQAT
jgi:trigger factor